MRFGRETLVAIGIGAGRAAIVEDFIRTHDRDRVAVQQAEGIDVGLDMLRTAADADPAERGTTRRAGVEHGGRELIAAEREEAEG